MKKTSLLNLILVLITYSLAQATVITVSNNPISAGQYTDLQTALNAAAVGDTIYIHGSSTSYGNVSMNKRLTLIGAGYNPIGTPANFKTILGQLTLDTNTFFTGCTGSKFIGLSLVASYPITNPSSAKNLTISRCELNGQYTIYLTQGSILENSICQSINIVGNNSNIIVRNNYIYGGVNYGQIQNANIPGVLFDHNVFTGPPGNTSYATFTNNFFFYCGDPTTWYNVANCTFSNNLSFDNPPVNTALPFGTNSGSGNLSATLPNYQFNNTLNAGVGYPALLNYDWALSPSSIGNNAATDGTDIGIYGGLYPMPNLTGVSNLIPQMTEMNILNPGVPVNGTLDIQFKARKQD